MFKKSLILLLLLFLSIGAVTASENATDISHDLLADENVESNISTFDDIQESINSAEANSTIFLNGTYKSLGREIEINKDIVLEGVEGGATLDADFTSTIFNIDSCNVTLINLNFINANSSASGGAISSNGKLMIINSSFINNSACDGGAIFSMDDLTIVNCTFSGNCALNDGLGGAIHVNGFDSKLSVVYSTFFKNMASDGAAIYSWGESSVRNSTFKSNIASSSVLSVGGAMSGVADVVNCTSSIILLMSVGHWPMSSVW